MTPPNPKVTAPERETDQQIASRLAETDWERAARISDKYTGVKSLLSCIRAIAEAQRLAREDEREQCAKAVGSFCKPAARVIRARSRQPGGAK